MFNISDAMVITNPMYPLKFEDFGDVNLNADPEFKSHLCSFLRHQPTCGSEMTFSTKAYSSRNVFKAEQAARAAYLEGRGAAARKALEISPWCPEAYNVMALFEAESYEEALGKVLQFVIQQVYG